MDLSRRTALLSEILNSIPTEFFQVSKARSFFRLFLSVFFYAAGIFILAKVPWFALPIGWVFLGAVFSGLNALGYDCQSGSFSRNRIVDWIVGNVVSLPLLFPFESWRFQTKSQDYEKALETLVSGPLWWFSSMAQWIRANVLLRSAFRPGYRLKLIGSISMLYLFAGLFFPLMLYFGGVWTLCKYWLIPWLVYHFWMSAFITTSYQCKIIGGKTERTLIVYCKYPRWVELLANDMNYVLTSQYYLRFRDNLSNIVPTYNVKASYLSLRPQWGKYFEEITFARPLKKSVMDAILSLKNINWPTALFLAGTFVLSVYAVFNVEAKLPTLIVGFISYYVGGLGITMGYHRLWAHRSYDASLPVRIFLLIIGSGSFEGSVLWWARDHRAHHRFSDTDKDPYGVDKGLLWAHIGWLLVKQNDAVIGQTDMSDLKKQRLLRWQDKNYAWFSVLIGIVIPTLICGVGWGDYWGGFFWASMVRTVVLMHATFCINSLAHYWGDATFSDQRSPRDSYIVSLITFGEGYHNFHHEFPYDYRNGVNYNAYDPGKWLIFLLSLFGLTYNLKRFPANEIAKGAVQMAEKKLQARKALIKWGADITTLPEYTWDKLKTEIKDGRSLLVIDGIVHDVSEWKNVHPGGKNMIECRVGTDATDAFTGGVYNHSYSAHNVLSMLRVGRIVDDDEKNKKTQ